MNNKVKKLKVIGIIAAVMILCFGMFTPTADAVKLETDLARYYDIEGGRETKDLLFIQKSPAGDIPFANVNFYIRTDVGKSCDIYYIDANSKEIKKVTASYDERPYIPVSEKYKAECSTTGTRLSALQGEKKVASPSEGTPITTPASSTPETAKGTEKTNGTVENAGAQKEAVSPPIDSGEEPKSDGTEVNWQADSTVDGTGAGDLDGIEVNYTTVTSGNAGKFLAVDWGKIPATNDAVPKGVTYKNAGILGADARINPTQEQTITFDSNIENPLLLVNWTTEQMSFDFGDLDVELLDSNHSTLANNVITCPGSANTRNDGFAVKIKGVFGPDNPLKFNMTSTSSFQSVGFTLVANKGESPIADSLKDFSGTQGENNWYYGYYSGDMTSADFKEMPQFDGNIWSVQPGVYWTILSADRVSANSTTTSGGRRKEDQWAVRRWVSPFSGSISITGHLAKFDGRADGPRDGVIGSIIVDGKTIWSQQIAAGDTTGIDYSVTAEAIKVGSTIDFAIAPGTNDFNDISTFTAQISSASTVTTGTFTESLCDRNISLQSWKGDYLHRPDSTQGVTTWNTGIGNQWTVECIDGGKIKLKSWKGDYLHRPDSTQGVTTWGTGIGNEWTVEPLGDNKIQLKSWKGDYLHRPDSAKGVTTWNTGIGNQWTVVQSKLLANGSFEEGTGNGPGSTLASWLMEGGQDTVVRIDWLTDAYPPSPAEGSFVLPFNRGGKPATGIIWQSFTTVPGTKYDLTFYSYENGNNGAAASKVQVQVDGQAGKGSLLDEIVEATSREWKQSSFSFVADSATTTLRFSDRSTGNLASTDFVLDDVSVTVAAD